jgi:hypothetical protein
MKTIVFFLILFPVLLNAQAPGDSCLFARDLGELPYCEDQLYTNLGAGTGDSVIIISDCFPSGLQDIWFKFSPVDTAVNYRLLFSPDTAGIPIAEAVVGIYSGDCTENGLESLYCFELGSAGDIFTEIRNLDPNQTYYIRVGSPEADAGDFTLCLEPRSDLYTIEETFSTACEGAVTDDGGIEGDYSANREDVFTICPETEHACLEFLLNFYALDHKLTGGDYIEFFNGPDTLSPLLFSTRQFNDEEGVPEGLYGGTGLLVKADSGCITLRFISDDTDEFEGFVGEWNCVEDSCTVVDSMEYTITPDDAAIESRLSTPYTEVMLKRINCPDSAFALFQKLEDSDFPITQGVLLTNGRASDGIGANDSIVRSTVWDSPGLPILDSLSEFYGSTVKTLDGCELEVTVFAQTDEMFMDYVFASEEYQDMILGDSNDLMGVFISGENIVPDPNIGPFKLFSTLPDGRNTPVQVHTVNQQNKYHYYHPNQGSLELAYDGYVTDSLNYMRPLTARTMVKPCNTYTFRMSIADRGTGEYDSGLFFSDIRAALPTISGPPRIIENCPIGNELVVIRANNPAMDTIKFYVEFSGSAEIGVDYIFDIPSPIILAPGEQQVSYPIVAIADSVRENTEQIIMTLFVDYGCGRVEVGTLEISLLDEPYVEVLGGQDTVIACFGETILNAGSNTQEVRWEPIDAVDDFQSSTVTVNIEQSQWLYVRGFTPGIPCDRIDSVFVEVVSPSGVANTDRNQICLGEQVTLTATDIDGDDFRWEPARGLSDPQGITTTVTPNRPTTYELVVTERGCEFRDPVFIQVDSLPDLTILTDPDSPPFCKGSTIQLSTENFIRTNYPGLQVNWVNYDPAIFVGDPGPGELNPRILINDPITLIRAARNGACIDTQRIDIEVIDPVLTLSVTDTLVCPDEEFDVIATVSNGTFNSISYEWQSGSGDIEIDGNGSQVTIVKRQPGTGVVNVTIIADGCTRNQSITIQVPDIMISLDAMPDVTVGEGEEVTLTGTVDPDMIHSITGYDWCKNGVSLGVNALQLIDRVLQDSQVYTLKVMDNLGVFIQLI